MSENDGIRVTSTSATTTTNTSYSAIGSDALYFAADSCVAVGNEGEPQAVELEKKEKVEEEAKEEVIEEQPEKKVRDLYITRDQLAIMKYDGKARIMLHNMEDTKESLGNLSDKNCRIRTGYNYPLLQSFILFDKNMNVLIPDDRATDGRKRRIHGTPYRRIPHLGVEIIGARGYASRKWAIVDRNEFIESRGRRLKVIEENIERDEKFNLKREIVREFKHAESVISMLKSIVNSVYDEDNYEIIYKIEFGAPCHTYEIYVQHHDLVIKNSIEMEHKIENIITRLHGKSYPDQEIDKIYLIREMSGIRTIFTEKDAVAGYSHSHIPSVTYGFGYFCMGDKHFLSGQNSEAITPLELESMLVAMYDHISWESLEGGPHFRMERIGRPKESSVWYHVFQPEGLLSYSTSREFIRDLLNLLKSKDLSGLKECFNPSFEREGTSIQVDIESFTKKFIPLFTSEEINYFISHYSERLRFHDCTITNDEIKFYSDNNRLSAKMAEKKIKDRINHMVPVYINGKYIKPRIINDGSMEEKEPDDGAYTIFSPRIINHIATVFQGCMLDSLRQYNNERKGKES